ncbi:hypothetical protein BBO99_00003112 [Phytophthora kernoviae]|uniref:Uncharacterized protein n=2 Tax=Phytophthora kernoviae TaxID=325452 RepID=A0A421FG08_9STRA|nr:hypothetical protein G195_003247 [Phytophthora kernoviae 00238/432]KAG2528933.1 hypothetical protein JM16_000956 [Phytophthora kernoviae]KAG2530257.1 hypothetical protein JM18_001037 [Phytophthora kernoviae]RLN44221.1 hypothetical protein BBI17_002977 [Phytophthora kernoviae]RLN82152.1 hypothetical protein BBO99_00003112 [Phytophthora kernoviae]
MPLFRRQQSCPSVRRKTRLQTQPESEIDAEPEASSRPPAIQAVYSLMSNSSKLFLAKPKPQTPAQTPRKPYSHSVDAVSEHELNPLGPGMRVATPFGLGKIVAVRGDDGTTAIQLQDSGVAYFGTAVMDEMLAVPALVGERVYTPSGYGRVLRYDVREQLYTLRLAAGGGLGEYELQLRPADVRPADHKDTRQSRRPRGLSEGSMDWDSRRSSSSSRARLSGSSPGTNGLAILKNFATTSYTFVASKYHHGQPVITKFGAGHILTVDPQRCTAQVQLLWGATAFLNADMIDYYPKALEGTDVQTKFGSGVVIGLRPADGIYTVRLHQMQLNGKSDVVYVPESDLYRVRKLAATAANVRGRLKAMAQRRFGERIVVAHENHGQEPSSAGI